MFAEARHVRRAGGRILVRGATSRKGLTTEAVQRLCQWGFDVLDAHRIEWWAVVGNEGSRAVAEAAGFEMEGLLRQRACRRQEPADWWVGGLLPRPE
ncbi:GNAT family N-acetyltransferase [Mycobacteroides abscessus]|uniref:GNAT family N-acetyltransferase n=1 Tax=Mycobacteroides abscessus TaxID=36809 RepID=UPI00355C4633